MRTLFILLLLTNVALFAMGQGMFGEPRSQRGKTPAASIKPEVQPDAITLSRARLDNK